LIKIIQRDLESLIFGYPVIQVEGWETIDEILLSEKQIVTEYSPSYIYCAVESTKIKEIHALEQAG
jgi:hypothetical protein